MDTSNPAQPHPPATSDSALLDRAIERAFPGVSPKDVCNPFRYSPAEKLLVLAALLIGLFWRGGLPRTTREDAALPDRLPAPPSLSFSGETLPAESQILETLARRELFLFPKKPAAPVRPPEPRGPGLREKLASLTLLGILEETPLQAIVESRKTRETYYLRAGDRLFSMEVVSVERDRVLFREGDETEILQ